MSVDRREFIATATGIVASLVAGSAHAQQAPTGKLGSIGIQLYTLRKMMEHSVAKTLDAVAKAGYKQIEFAGYFNTPVAVVRKMLDDRGLVSPSAHIQVTDLGPTWDVQIENAVILGQKYLTVAWIDAADRTLDGYKRIADLFNRSALRARRDGVRLAYHTYSYEWNPLPGGMIPFDILLKETGPENLAIEADVFWMRQAGQDPLEWFAKYPGRFRMLHAKDMGPAPQNEMRDVGKGVVDWKNLFAHRKEAGLEYVFVENDETRDPIASIASSYRYLRSLRFAG